MGKADRERAERGELHRDGKKAVMKPCPFPGCNYFVHPESPYGACEKHSDLISDVAFIIDHMRLPGQRASAARSRRVVAGGLTLPGDPGFDIRAGRRKP